MTTNAKKPSDDELTVKYQALLGDPFQVEKVMRCNYKPHPFVIGTRHVAEASDHHGGMLTEAVCRKIPCAYSEGSHGRYDRCTVDYDNHTSDHVLFVKVIRNCSNKEASQALFRIKETMLADKLDGVAFIESGFRIAPPTPDHEEAREP